MSPIFPFEALIFPSLSILKWKMSLISKVTKDKVSYNASSLMLDLWPLSGNDLHRSLRKASTQQSIEVPDRILNNKRRETSGDIGITSGKDTVFEKKSCIYVGVLPFWLLFGTFCNILPIFVKGYQISDF